MKYTKFNIGDVVYMAQNGGNDSGHRIYDRGYSISKGDKLYNVTDVIKNNDSHQESRFQYTLILNGKYPVWASHCKLSSYDIY